MKTFLHEVAEDLYARYGEGLSERAILFRRVVRGCSSSTP